MFYHSVWLTGPLLLSGS